jgi:ribosome maturation protein SDO1
MSQGLKQAVN